MDHLRKFHAKMKDRSKRMDMYQQLAKKQKELGNDPQINAVIKKIIENKGHEPGEAASSHTNADSAENSQPSKLKAQPSKLKAQERFWNSCHQLETIYKLVGRPLKDYCNFFQ